MPTRSVKVIYSQGPRPPQAPEGWLVWNASRPLSASERPDGTYAEWTGDFRHGLLYSATNPEDPYFAQRNRENDELDGWLMQYVSAETMRQESLQAWFEKYGEDYVRYQLQGWDEQELADHLIEQYHMRHEQDRVEVPSDRPTHRAG